MAQETPVSLLNQLCTQNEIAPIYNLIAREGRVHAPVFTYQVQLLDMTEEGSGQSKKKAKHIAARLMLKRMLGCEQICIEEKDQAAIERCLAYCDEEDVAEGLLLARTSARAHAAASALTGGEAAAGGGDAGKVDAAREKPVSASSDVSGIEEINPIGKLQEICMKKYWHPPVYEDIGEKGLPHERMFQVVCIIENMDLKETGIGKSKKLAKRAAAQEMINKLRKENLDKVDELLDRLPRTAHKSASFDLVSEILNMKKNRDSTTKEDRMRATFYRDLLSDQAKLEALKSIFAGDLQRYLVSYIDESTIMPEVEKLIDRIEALLQVKLEISTYSEKRDDDCFQCLGQFSSKEAKYEGVTILCSYGADVDLDKAKQKTKSRCVVVLLTNII